MRVFPQKSGLHARVVTPGARTSARASAVHAAATAEDPFIAQVLALAPPSTTLAPALHADAAAALAAARMPTTRNELFRFTDIGPLVRKTLTAAQSHHPDAVARIVSNCALPAADASRVVIVNGCFDASLSDLTGLPASVYVGEADRAPSEVIASLGAQSRSRGGVFAALNSAACQSAVAVSVPSDVVVEVPIHVVYISAGSEASGSVCASAPRLLVHIAERAAVEVVEEFVALDDAQGRYHVNAVTEAAVLEDGTFKHSYIELDAPGAFHTKATLVTQAVGSRYSIVENRLGASLSRHDLDIQQDGELTHTEMKHFVLSSEEQLHDLHTRLVLDHPEGVARQLHKCIASDATSRAVFDGSVQVLRRAQQTDAGQLSRNLLLVPKAMVNVKPNLQIIANDVKCTHGCAVSDLSLDEMFYFRSRGIDEDTARKALVFSFGAEVIQQLRYKELVARLQVVVNSKLEKAAR